MAKIIFLMAGRKLINERVHFPLALMTLASVAKQCSCEFSIIDARIKEDDEWINELLLNIEDADVLGVSCLTGPGIEDCMEAINLCRIKNKRAITIWGGYHATARYIEIINSKLCDAVIRGPGELALEKIINLIEQNPEDTKEERLEKMAALDSVYVNGYDLNKKLIINPSDWEGYPKVNYDSVDTKDYLNSNGNILDFVTSYGCPGHCKFCVEPDKNCSKWFGITAEKVVTELLNLVDKYHPARISIVDPEFGGNPNRLKNIIELLKEKNFKTPLSLNFRVCDILYLDKHNLVKMLPDIGIMRVVLGIESGSNSMLKKIGKSQTAEQAKSSCKTLSSLGIETYANFIHDFPDETDEDTDANLKFIKEIAQLSKVVQIHHFFTPFAGSEYFKHLPVDDLQNINWEHIDTRRAISGNNNGINIKRRKKIIVELSKLSKKHPDNIPIQFLPTLIAFKCKRKKIHAYI